MRAVVAFLFAVLLSTTAFAQKPPINAVAGPTTSAQLRSIVTDPSGSGALTFGGATVTGSLIPGNVANLTATGITDSGVQLLTVLPATTVWGNNGTSSGPPAALTVLNMANGTPGAPIYSFATDATSGLYMVSSGVLGLSGGGKIMLKLNTPGSSANYIEMSANNTPTIRANGTNIPLQIAGSGTGGVDLMTAGASNYLWRLAASGTVVNYFKSTATASGAGAIKIEAVGGDANIDVQLSPLGTGLLQFSNSTSFSANGSVATTMTSLGPTGAHTTIQEWLTVKNSAGVTRYVPAY